MATNPEKAKYTQKDVDNLIAHGNRVMKKFNLIEELNRMGIRSDGNSRGYEGVAEISAAIALVERRYREQREKKGKSDDDDMVWL